MRLIRKRTQPSPGLHVLRALRGASLSKLNLLLLLAVLPLALTADTVVRERGLNREPEMPNCGRPPVEPDQGSSEVKERFVFKKRTGWQNGGTIRVYFMNGTARERGIVEHFAREWEKYANIRFDFRRERKSGRDYAILIKFQAQRAGIAGWSKLGGGTTSITKPSMSFKRGISSSRTVLHEFGHALGLLHEQNNPAGRSNWNMSEAYKYFRARYGWNRAQFRKQIINKANVKNHNWGKFDPNSIMAYYFPARLFRNGRPFGGKRVLSPMDRAGIARMYPGRKTVRNKLPTFLFYSTRAKRLRFRVEDGHGKLWINNRLVLDKRHSGPRRRRSDYVDIRVRARNGRVKVRHSFKALGPRAFFIAYLYESGQRKPILTYYCTINRPCFTGNRAEYYLTHFQNRNRDSGNRPVAVKTSGNKGHKKKARINPALDRRILSAAHGGDANRVRELLQEGANPNASWRGWTPLMYAASNGHYETVRLLLKSGANPNAKVSGWTPLKFARRKGHGKIAALLAPVTNNTRTRSRSFFAPRAPRLK